MTTPAPIARMTSDLVREMHKEQAPADDTFAALPMQFTFIEFNERRAMRGADAARVDVMDPHYPDGGPGWLWMNRSDIKANMRDHGNHPELQKALAAYGAWK